MYIMFNVDFADVLRGKNRCFIFHASQEEQDEEILQTSSIFPIYFFRFHSQQVLWQW